MNPLALKEGDQNLQTQTDVGSTKVSEEAPDPWLYLLLYYY